MISLRKITDNDIPYVTWVFRQHWGGDFIVTRRRIHKPEDLDAFIAEDEEKKLGLITFRVFDNELKIISLNSFVEKQGIGSLLLEKVVDEARLRKLQRAFVITTNDNLNALRFYQKRGFHLLKIYPNALEETRKLKPQLPLIGKDGIPLQDEIELERKL